MRPSSAVDVDAGRTDCKRLAANKAPPNCEGCETRERRGSCAPHKERGTVVALYRTYLIICRTPSRPTVVQCCTRRTALAHAAQKPSQRSQRIMPAAGQWPRPAHAFYQHPGTPRHTRPTGPGLAARVRRAHTTCPVTRDTPAVSKNESSPVQSSPVKSRGAPSPPRAEGALALLLLCFPATHPPGVAVPSVFGADSARQMRGGAMPVAHGTSATSFSICGARGVCCLYRNVRHTW